VIRIEKSSREFREKPGPIKVATSWREEEGEKERGAQHFPVANFSPSWPGSQANHLPPLTWPALLALLMLSI